MALGFGEERLAELRKTGGILMPEDIAAGVVELIEGRLACWVGDPHHGTRWPGLRGAMSG